MTGQDVVIIADDVTGAGDTAVQFSNAGWTAELKLRSGESDAQVVAVSTDSRPCSDADAAARVREAAKDLLRGDGTRVFKKIDSTVRGPIRAEIDALLDVLGPGTTAVVCPAFPGVGRTVVDGSLLVDGRPVSETSAGTDPVTPVTQSHVPTLLGAPLVRLDPDGSPAAWARRLRDAGRVVVVDAETDADLDRVARAVAELGESALPVGAGGLAGALAHHWRPSERSRTVLVVVTSLHSAAREQARALAGTGATCHEPTARQLLDEGEWSSFSAEVLASAAGQPDTLLLSAPERADEAVPPALVARRLADVAARVVRATGPAGLVVTGGDGARALLDHLDGTGIRLHGDGPGGQAGPGVALGTLVGGWAAGLPVATKAGASATPTC
ncbi:four-carbon acid sugar kinase family protein [Prauserella oleivorans]